MPPGGILGLLGPNGAGKTTAVRVLATLLRPDAGRARIMGADVVAQAAEVRTHIGLTGQYAALDDYLTGRANLIMIGQLARLGRAQARLRAAELLERFDLTTAAGRAVKTYSGGMRRRLDLAASLIGRPEVLFLDEPTTGWIPEPLGRVGSSVGWPVGTTPCLHAVPGRGRPAGGPDRGHRRGPVIARYPDALKVGWRRPADPGAGPRAGSGRGGGGLCTPPGRSEVAAGPGAAARRSSPGHRRDGITEVIRSLARGSRSPGAGLRAVPRGPTFLTSLGPVGGRRPARIPPGELIEGAA